MPKLQNAHSLENLKDILNEEGHSPHSFKSASQSVGQELPSFGNKVSELKAVSHKDFVYSHDNQFGLVYSEKKGWHLIDLFPPEKPPKPPKKEKAKEKK